MWGYEPPSKALEMVKIAFYRACRYDKFITLHIDDGRLGGGTSIPYYEYTDTYWTSGFAGHISYDGIHDKYFLYLPDGSPSHRNGIFHYAVFGDKGDDHGDEDFWGIVPYVGSYKIFIAKGKIKDDVLVYEEEAVAHTFMHELGHNLGLDADWLFKNGKRDWWGGWPHPPIDDDDLPSCMRYGAKKGDRGYIDYSGKKGTIWVYNDGNNNYELNPGWVPYETDEWGRIDLTLSTRGW